MSKLSKVVSKLGDSVSGAVHNPLKALANVATLGQLSKLKGALKGNVGALVGTGLAPGMGTLAGGYLDQLNTKKNKAEQAAQDKQTTANTNLNNVLNGINGGDNSGSSPYFNTPQGAVTGQPYMSPNQSQPQLANGALPFDTLSPDIQQTLAAQSPALASRLKQIVGPGTGEAQTSAGQLLNANDLTSQLSQQTLDKQADMRKQQITDMASLLNQQADTSYSRSLPGLYEDLNTRGLLRSSDLGNQMATKKQQSFEDVANQLGQQQLGYNDQYINGMGNITNQYNSGIGSALQREFSLQDYANQVKASQALGQAVAPVQPYNGKTATQAVGNAATLGSTGAKIAGVGK